MIRERNWVIGQKAHSLLQAWLAQYLDQFIPKLKTQGAMRPVLVLKWSQAVLEICGQMNSMPKSVLMHGHCKRLGRFKEGGICHGTGDALKDRAFGTCMLAQFYIPQFGIGELKPQCGLHFSPPHLVVWGCFRSSSSSSSSFAFDTTASSRSRAIPDPTSKLKIPVGNPGTQTQIPDRRVPTRRPCQIRCQK